MHNEDIKQDKKFLRQCACCKKYKNKSDLIRITKDYKTGETVINNENEINGRSVYICKEADCISTAIKKKKIEYALKTVLSENVKKKLATVLPK